MKLKIFVVALLALLLTSAAQAQVPTDNRRTLIFDSVSQPACSGTFETWQMHNGSCTVQGPLPWIASVRVRSGSVITTIPRAQVQRLTTTAECTPNAVPCLRIQDVPLSAGNVDVTFVSDTGVMGVPSTAVPFSPAVTPPAAPGTLRLVVP